MAWPVPRVEVATNATRLDLLRSDPSPVWTDITDDVLGSAPLRCTRGRSGESTGSTAGTMQVVLKGYVPTEPFWGTSGWSPQFYGPGPYSPRLTVGTPVRVWAATGPDQFDAEPVWTGHVTDLSLSMAGGVRPVLRVSAADAAAHLASVAPLDALHLAWPRRLGGLAYQVPLDDREGATPRVVGLPLPGGATIVLPGVSPVLRPLPVGSPDPAAKVVLGAPGAGLGAGDATVAEFTGATDAGGWVLEASDAQGRMPGFGSGPFTVSMFFRVDESGRAQTLLSALAARPAGAGLTMLDVGVDDRDRVRVFLAGAWHTSEAAVRPREWHHLAVSAVGSAGSLRLASVHLDGADLGLAGASAQLVGTGLAASRWRLGASVYLDAWPLNGAIAGVTWHEGPAAEWAEAALLPQQVADIAAGVSGWAGESTALRWSRLMGLAVDDPMPMHGPGSGQVGAQATAGRSLAAALDELSTVEGVPWYVSALGNPVQPSRSSRFDRDRLLADLLTLEPSEVSPATEAQAGTRGLVTRAAVSRPGGQPQVVADPDAEARIGALPVAVSAPFASDAAAATYARWLVDRGRLPRPQVDALAVAVSAVAGTVAGGVPAVMGAGPGTAVEVPGAPQVWGGRLRGIVAGVSDEYSPGAGWRRVLAVGDADEAVWDFGAWVLGTGVLGESTDPGRTTRLGL